MATAGGVAAGTGHTNLLAACYRLPVKLLERKINPRQFRVHRGNTLTQVQIDPSTRVDGSAPGGLLIRKDFLVPVVHALP